MDFNIEIRKKQLESLDQFVTSSRDKLQSILDSLDWSADKIEEEKLYVTCPYNLGHKVPSDKIEEHMDWCKIKNAGYDLKENFLSESGSTSEERSIKLDTIKKIEVLSHALTQTPYFQTAWNGQDPDPKTYNRLITTFSRDERLALYNYCVANTKAPQELPEFDTSLETKQDTNIPYTEKALMSFERDIKRRSVKYKPIHTNHKNYKEVLREVINSQMQQYNDWLLHSNSSKGPHTPEYCSNEEEKGEEPDHQDKELVERPHSSVSRVSNRSSSSRNTIRKRESTSKSHSRHHSRERGVLNNKDEISNYSRHSSMSKYGYSNYEEESQDSNNVSKISTSLKSEDSSYEYYENFSRTHSRDSSIISSHKSKEKHENYKERKRRKSRSPSNNRKVKKHRKNRSKSRHRSRDRKSHKHDKTSTDRRRKYEKHHHTS